MPSATVAVPSALARRVIAVTIRPSLSRSTVRTSERSILSSSKGSPSSRASEEWPVPKSSIERRKPILLSEASRFSTVVECSTTPLSVISSVNARASTPCSARIAASCSASDWS